MVNYHILKPQTLGKTTFQASWSLPSEIFTITSWGREITLSRISIHSLKSLFKLFRDDNVIDLKYCQLVKYNFCFSSCRHFYWKSDEKAELSKRDKEEAHKLQSSSNALIYISLEDSDAKAACYDSGPRPRKGQDVALGAHKIQEHKK